MKHSPKIHTHKLNTQLKKKIKHFLKNIKAE